MSSVLIPARRTAYSRVDDQRSSENTEFVRVSVLDIDLEGLPELHDPLLVGDVMTCDLVCIGEDENLLSAAKRMRNAHIGALPVVGNNGSLVGIITDRDIVVRCLALEQDPVETTAGQIMDGEVFTVDISDDLDMAASVMETQQVRRLPVVEEGNLVGIISQADLSHFLSHQQLGEVLQEISLP